MDAKEKSKELINKFVNYSNGTEGLTNKYDDNIAYINAIDCSLVMVDSLINETAKKYWYQVKKELIMLKNKEL